MIISAAPFTHLSGYRVNEIPQESSVAESAEATFVNCTKSANSESLPAPSGSTVTTITLIGSTAVAGVIGAGGLGT